MFFDHYRLSQLDRDTSVWLNRPLTPDLEFGIVCDVIYLLDLHRAAVDAMLKPVELVTKEFVSVFREVSEVFASYVAVRLIWARLLEEGVVS